MTRVQEYDILDECTMRSEQRPLKPRVLAISPIVGRNRESQFRTLAFSAETVAMIWMRVRGSPLHFHSLSSPKTSRSRKHALPTIWLNRNCPNRIP